MILDRIQARLFFAPVAWGHIVPPFENHVPLVITAYYLVLLKAGPKLDHMTRFSFHGNHFRCFQVAPNSFSCKNLQPNILHKWYYFLYIMKVKQLK